MICKNCLHDITRRMYDTKNGKKGELKHWYHRGNKCWNTIDYKPCLCEKAEEL